MSWGKSRRKWKADSRQESNPWHLWLSCQCSATEPQQLDNHQPSPHNPLYVLFSRCRSPYSTSTTHIHFPLFLPHNFPYFQNEVRCSEHLEWENPFSMGSLLMERIFQSNTNGSVTAHTKWLPGVRLRHSVPPVQHIQRVGGFLAAVAQWQSTGGSNKRCHGFDSWCLLAFTLSSIFAS